MYKYIFFLRKAKAILLRLNIHVLIDPFFGFFLNLIYMSKFSKWRKEIGKLPFDDFYNNNVKYEDRFKLHQYIFETQRLDEEINYIEFGVAEGTSFKWWVNKNKNSQTKFYGFDTFTGLPEDFGAMKKHDYDTKGIFPDVNNDPRCTFIPGLFQSSLKNYINKIDFSKRLVLHMDADLYSSTLYVLTMLVYKFKKDDIIIFDEFGVPTHEFRAFFDFLSAYQIKFEYLGAVNNYLQLAIRIL